MINQIIMFAWFLISLFYVYMFYHFEVLFGSRHFIIRFESAMSIPYNFFFFPNWLEKRKWMTHHPSQTDPERRSSNTSI